MSFTLVRAVRWTAIAAGIIGYAVLAHYSAATSAATTFPVMGVAVSLAPSLAILLLLAWRSPRRLAMLFLCAGVGLLLWGLRRGAVHRVAEPPASQFFERILKWLKNLLPVSGIS